jgi:signal peptidase I
VEREKNAAQRKRGKRTAGNVILNLCLVLASLIMTATIGYAVYRVTHPSDDTFFGYKPLLIETDSMEDTIMTGALVIAYREDFRDLREGDVITFARWPDERLNTHRIIGIDGGQLTTQGDNTDRPDPTAVNVSTYKYKVLWVMNWVAKLGRWPDALTVLVWPAAGLALLIALCVTVRLARRARRRRADRAAQTPPAPPEEKRGPADGRSGWREGPAGPETAGAPPPEAFAPRRQPPREPGAYGPPPETAEPRTHETARHPAPPPGRAAYPDADYGPDPPAYDPYGLSAQPLTPPRPAPPRQAGNWRDEIFDGVNFDDEDLRRAYTQGLDEDNRA